MSLYELKVTGFDELVSAMKAMSGKEFRTTVKKASRDGADIILRRVQDSMRDEGLGNHVDAFYAIPWGLNSMVSSRAPKEWISVWDEQATWSRRPPMNTIVTWAQKRLGLNSRDAKSFYFAWTTAKMPRLITPRPFFNKGIERAMPEVNRLLDQLTQHIYKRFGN